MRNILLGLGIGIPALILLAWIVATVGEGLILLAGIAFIVLVVVLVCVRWAFVALRGVGRWARRQ
jgi:hypothetical protein